MKTGDKLICINVDGLSKKIHMSSIPVLGGIYTVRGIPPRLKYWCDKPGVLLEEITGDMSVVNCFNGKYTLIECHFYQDRFMKLLY